MKHQMQLHRSFLVKPASYDCNLRCDYCFYRRTEESYPDTGAHRMGIDTFTALVDRAQTPGTQTVSYVFQGGEPMLMGLDFYRRAVDIQRERRQPGQTILNTIQTNGVGIDGDWARFLAGEGFLVGISIDGPRELHDIHRFTRAGTGVFDRVLEACDIMSEFGVEYNILTVVTNETVGRARDIYSFLRERGFHYLQFIDCIEAVDGEIAPFSLDPAAFGEFLCELFDAWFEEGYPSVSIRLFDNLLQYHVGRIPECCMYKSDCGSYFVIEYNGDVYPCDFFVKPEWLLGNLREHTFEELIDHPKRLEFAALRDLPHERCESCRWLGFCMRGCIKSRIFPDGDYRSLNYLCDAYRAFFEYTGDRYRFLAWDIMRRQRGEPPPVHIGRNDPCPCGSGRKYKKCCEQYSHIMRR